MKSIKTFILLGVVQLGLIGCASVPEKSELQQLSAQEIEAALVGNTYTYTEQWGRYASYYSPGGTGHAKAWGSWGSESSTSEYSLDGDGELCESFSGGPDWANPDYEYCNVFYTDSEGNYYTESTQHPHEPAKEGKIRPFDIKAGDKYELAG